VPITFNSPAEFEGADETRLLLYLYQVETNAYLRNLPGTIEPPPSCDSQSQEQENVLPARELIPPPIVVDLHYMAVPYAMSGEFELEIVNGLVRALDRCGTIADEYLDDGLKKSGNVSLHVVPEFTSTHVLRDLWASLPQKAFRLTKLYAVTPVRIPIGDPVSVYLPEKLNMSLLQRVSSAGEPIRKGA
jgi:Pvc16 N-terminal domain